MNQSGTCYYYAMQVKWVTTIVWNENDGSYWIAWEFHAIQYQPLYVFKFGIMIPILYNLIKICIIGHFSILVHCATKMK